MGNHGIARGLAALALAIGAAAACGGPDEALPDARPIDAAGSIDCGLPSSCGECRTWRYDEREADAIEAIDPAPLHPERTLRVRIGAELGACEELAMMQPRIDAEARRAVVLVAVFRAGGSCTGQARRVTRPVELRLPAPGTWTVAAGVAPGAPSITVEVGPPPARACGAGPPGACEMDCDCDGPGERCLGGEGLAGPFLACARPCELDRDCGGAGRCVSFDDGLDAVCDPDVECGPTRPCPAGWSCDGGACQPGFVLGGAARRPCTCDRDCDAPLRCVEDASGGGARCELACPTGGWWCQGAHVCGRAAEDLAGLAGSDAVCVWLGE